MIGNVTCEVKEKRNNSLMEERRVGEDRKGMIAMEDTEVVAKVCIGEGKVVKAGCKRSSV